jgi:hypothetical protein
MKPLIPVLALLIACGADGEDDEPIDGSIVITVGTNTITPVVGAALVDPEDPNDMVLVIGTEAISCSTNADAAPKGSAFAATVPQMAGTYDVPGYVSRWSGNTVYVNGSVATVIVGGLGDRITGSVEFATTDEDDGEITVSGTFGVISCL